MKKVTISYKNHLEIDGKFSRQRCLNPDLDPVFKKSMVPDLVYTSLEVGFGTGQYQTVSETLAHTHNVQTQRYAHKLTITHTQGRYEQGKMNLNL